MLFKKGDKIWVKTRKDLRIYYDSEYGKCKENEPGIEEIKEILGKVVTVEEDVEVISSEDGIEVYIEHPSGIDYVYDWEIDMRKQKILEVLNA